ncbi:phosphopantetheine-binding protein [Streptomyces sp. M19]
MPALAELLTEYAEKLAPTALAPAAGAAQRRLDPGTAARPAPRAGHRGAGGEPRRRDGGSIWSVWYPVGEVDPDWPSIPYGVPMPHQSIRVLDDQLRPRPDWVAGELYIGGRGVAAGYWRDEEQTGQVPARPGDRRAAVPDRRPRPPSARREPGVPRQAGRPGEDQRLPRRAGRGRVGAAAAAAGAGRRRDRDRRAGHGTAAGRLHLTEPDPGHVAGPDSEHLTEPDSDHVASEPDPDHVTEPDPDHVTEPDPDREPAALRAELGAVLPSYMVPARFHRLDRIPLTGNGKVDRAALRATAARARRPGRERAPLDPGRHDRLLAELAAVWAELLAVPSVQPQDSFFALGGTSLEAIRLVARLQRDLGVRVRLERLFTTPTLAALAEAVAEAQGGTGPNRARPPR